MTSFILPSKIDKCGICAFYDCSKLTTVTIQNPNMTFDQSAFESCDLLKTINFNGTMQQWNAVIKRSSQIWIDRTASYSVICTDGQLTK